MAAGTAARRQRAALKMRLLGQRREIMERLQESDDVSAVRAADVADQATDCSNDEMQLKIMEMRAGQVASIEAAIERIAEGTYGICDSCGCRIPAARLKLIPSARCCVRCQAEIEREQDDAELMADWSGVEGFGGEESHSGAYISGSKL